MTQGTSDSYFEDKGGSKQTEKMWKSSAWVRRRLWWSELRKRIGLWFCRRGWHKMKQFVSVDWASRGSMIQEAFCCQRCGLIVLVDVRGLTTEKKKQLRNAVYGLQEYEKIRAKKVR